MVNQIHHDFHHHVLLLCPALDTLDNYDYERLTINDTTQEEPFHATYENAMAEIARHPLAR